MLPQEIKKFPISEYLDDICSNLHNSQSHFLILTAETAAGKSTILPLALLEQFSGKIFITEPRRLAVLGVASRVSELKNQPIGKDVGYKIHLESKISSETRLEVATEAILVKQLQADPALEEYNVVVIDEFHERSVNTDLALAFLKEAMQLRDDLFVIIMSATIDTEKLKKYLSKDSGKEVPVMKIPGRQFPVEIVYDDKNTVSSVIRRAIGEKPDANGGNNGDILVFLPGIADIRRVQEEVQQDCDDADIELCILHSSISLEEQRKIISVGQKKRVILSSAIAETSLTVPGITCVIDSGLSRVNRMNVSTGMETLSTETESEFSAEQRSGRAGRIQKGKCIRLWSQANKRIREMPPEILRADITSLVLECCNRGIYSAEGIDWLDKPSEASWNESVKLLQSLGMIKEDLRITQKGRTALILGIHPRLAGIAIDGYSSTTARLNTKANKLLLKYSTYNRSTKDIQIRFIKDLERRLSGVKEEEKDEQLLVLSGYPDRIAKRLSPVNVEPAEYQFASGRKALYRQGRAPEWIVAPEVLAGEQIGTIFEFEEISEAKIMEFVQIHAKKREKCSFLNKNLQKNEEICYGEIVIMSKKMPVSDGDFARAWVDEVQKNGIEKLPIDEKTQKFLGRVSFWNQQKGTLEKDLRASVEEWLVPFIGRERSLNVQMVYDALYWYLDGATIDKEVPEMLVLENGRKCKIKYEKLSSPDDKNVLVIRPVLEIIIQRIFGCFKTPQVCGMKVLLRLLSPANRPLQVTDDLEHFWNGAWIEICKEMKGRYPKHNWDYKVIEKD